MQKSLQLESSEVQVAVDDAVVDTPAAVDSASATALASQVADFAPGTHSQVGDFAPGTESKVADFAPGTHSKVGDFAPGTESKVGDFAPSNRPLAIVHAVPHHHGQRLLDDRRASYAHFWSAITLVAQLAVDAGSVVLAFLAGYKLYRLLPFGTHTFVPHLRFAALAMLGAGVMLATFHLNGLYHQRGSMLHVRELEIVFRSTIFQVLLWWAIPYALKVVVPRLLVVVIAGLIIITATAGRLLLTSVLQRLFASARMASRIVILGTSDTGLRLFRKLAQSANHGLQIVGFLTTRPGRSQATQFYAPSYGEQRARAAVLGSLAQLDAIARENALDGVIIADELNPEQVAALESDARKNKLAVRVAPSTYGFYSHWIDYTDVDGLPLGHCRPPEAPLLSRAVKRALDVVGALLALALFSPLFLVLAVLIPLDSRGPVFFKQERVGRNGVPFQIFKFRSMHVHAPAYAVCPKTSQDQRITRVGRWLRRLSIDELPQLINVLRGEMSLVGPRPEMPFIVHEYSPYECERLRAKPGITGLWQISADRARPIHENIEYDIYYLEHQSVFLDLVIMLNTAFFMIRGLGAW